MNSVEAFRKLVQDQQEYLDWIIEADNYYCSPLRWGKHSGQIVNGNQRRGWTRQDKNRYAMVQINNRSTLPPKSYPKELKRCSTRLERILRLVDFEAIAAHSGKTAIDFVCTSTKFEAIVVPAISRLLATHLELLRNLKSWQPSDVESRWRQALGELSGMEKLISAVHAITEKGVSLRDVGIAIGTPEEDLNNFVTRFSKSKKISATKIGKDGQRQLYRLFEIVRDLESFSPLSAAQKSRVVKHLEQVQREPKESR